MRGNLLAMISALTCLYLPISNIHKLIFTNHLHINVSTINDCLSSEKDNISHDFDIDDNLIPVR